METRGITLTLDKAKEWFNSGNDALKEAALQAFTEEELKEFDFRSIKCFEDAVCAIYGKIFLSRILFTCNSLHKISTASAASFKLNIIRKALNKGHEMKFTEGNIFYPYNYLLANKNYYKKNEDDVAIAKIKIDNKGYTLFGGRAENASTVGLGYFDSLFGIAYSYAFVGFLGCATKEIAEHFGKYFAKEIFEAKYGDLIDYEWID